MESGRPRDTDITERVLAAAREPFLAGGMDGLNFGALATAAGTSRTAIYRRWPNKIDLALDLIESSAHPGELPLTGTLVEDLTQHTMQNAGNQLAIESGTDPRELWSVLLSPEILGHYMERVGNKRRMIGRSIITSWVDRGGLPPDTDGDLILDTLAGLTLFRSVVPARPVTENEVRSIARALCENPPRR